MSVLEDLSRVSGSLGGHGAEERRNGALLPPAALEVKGPLRFLVFVFVFV